LPQNGFGSKIFAFAPRAFCAIAQQETIGRLLSKQSTQSLSGPGFCPILFLW
jgi:hypothetical protein